MKIIKLTYLSYAWYLALTEGKEHLTTEKPEAWDYGPVFPSLYHNLKKYGKTQIDSEIPGSRLSKIKDEDKPFLNKMWEMYGNYGGVYLSAITHTHDSPWYAAKKKGYNTIIEDKDILDHYASKLKPKEESSAFEYNTTNS